ncbi:hypothetical protein AB0958_09745 [Streptomyces sp. NPDC006655]|uniref:hypothetical protein n=1 Tax=Streptomyces sp. NPDC006655 TaxID=3156898 RepID=UPI003456355C
MTCALCGNTTRGHLCTRHRDQLAAGLKELPALYAEVGECLVPRRSNWGDIIPTRGSAGPRSPINEDVLDNINWVRAAEMMRSWREDVRRVRWPHRGAPPPGSLADDCRWLAAQLDWISDAYPAAGDLAREVWTLEQQARHIVGDPLPRRKVIGQCISITDEAGTVCGATITHLAGESRLVCGVCHTVYEGQQDLLLLLHYQPEPV